MEAGQPGDGGASAAEMVAQVERALYQLYNDPDSANKSAADQWLQALQQSPEAWTLPWILLQHQSLEVRNYGALLLNSKISKAWSELPVEQHDILRVELFKHLSRFSSGPTLVLIQLCRALVGVAFQTMPQQWPNTVVSCIHSLKKACQDQPGSDFPSAVVQLLTIFPEEFDKLSSSTIASRGGTIKGELSAGLQGVLNVVEEIITKAQANSIKDKAIKCCASWLLVGVSISDLGSLTEVLFQCLSERDLMESAAEVLSEVILQDDSFKYPGVLRKFLQRVLDLRVFVRKKLVASDVDYCVALGKVVQGTALSNVNFLMSISEDSSEEDCDDALEMVQLVMDFFCVSGTYPVDERCSEETLVFWSSFMEQVAGQDPEQGQFLLQFYSSQIHSLIEAFPDKARYPLEEDWKESWIDDDKDDFIKYREDLCDLGEVLQQTMHAEYVQNLTGIFTKLLSTQAPPPWQRVEAVLYLLQGVASNITQQSSPLLQGILALFPRMPPHPTLIKTALSFLGLLSTWLKHYPSVLQNVIPMILGALSQPTLAPSAALAFRDMCIECASELSAVAKELVPHCKQSLSDPSLSSRDCVCIVAAIGSVLSTLPLPDLLPPLEALVGSRVEHLQDLAREDPTTSNKMAVEKELDVLGALCHHIYPDLGEGEQHPVVLLLIQLFPAVQLLISKWCTDHSIVECVCVMVTRAMRTVAKQYSPLLEQTIELVVKCYAAVHHHKLLDTATQIVGTFGSEESCSSLLSALLQPLHSSTLQLFQTAMKEHPDVVQSYMKLNTTTLKVNANLLLSTDGIVSNIFDIGLAALKLPEQPTVSTASNFFVAFLGVSGSVAAVGEVTQVSGKNLLHYVLQAIAWAAPRSYAVSFSSILCALQGHCVTLLSQWLEELLSQDGFPSNHLTPDEKQQFKSAVLRCQQNKRLLTEQVKEFSLKCRGFHGTVYALDTL